MENLCGTMMTLMGRSHRYWACPNCHATIGAHPNGKPVGFAADREERRKAHADMDYYMLITGISLNQMYQRIAKLMRIARGNAHVGMLNLRQCHMLRRLLSRDLLDVGVNQSPV